MFSHLKLEQQVPIIEDIVSEELQQGLLPFIVEDSKARDRNPQLSALFERAIYATPPGGSENNHIHFWGTLFRASLAFLSSHSSDLKLFFNCNDKDQSGVAVELSAGFHCLDEQHFSVDGRGKRDMRLAIKEERDWFPGAAGGSELSFCLRGSGRNYTSFMAYARKPEY